MSRGEEHNPASAQEQLRRQRQEWYYQVGGPPTGETDTSSPFPHDIIRVRLDEDWYDCDTATGHVLELDDDGKLQTQHVVSLRDPLGIKAGSPLYDVLGHYMPGGVDFWAIATYDGPAPDNEADDSYGPYYEPLPFGIAPDQCSSSPSSSSPSPSSSSPSPSSSSPSPSSSSPSPSSSSPSGPSESPSGSCGCTPPPCPPGYGMAWVGGVLTLVPCPQSTSPSPSPSPSPSSGSHYVSYARTIDAESNVSSPPPSEPTYTI